MTEENKQDDKKEGSQEPSKMPDLKEIGAMAGKLFSDVKKSIGEIINDYKSKRPETPKAEVKPDETAATAKAEPEVSAEDESCDEVAQAKPEEIKPTSQEVDETKKDS
jgi:Sec-independent protein translocase protein TatA